MHPADATSPRSAPPDAACPPQPPIGDPAFDTARAIPPRYWWLKRLSLLGAVALLSLAGLWFWWSWVASSRLEAAIAAIRARGEPVKAEDLVLPPVPDDQNAVPLLIEVFEKLTYTDAELDLLARTDSISSTRSLERELSEVLEKRAALFAIVREARSREKAVWPPSWSPLPFKGSPLTKSRVLTTSLIAQSYLSAVQGRCRDVAEFLRDAIAVADYLSSARFSGIGHLVHLYCVELTPEAIEQIGLAMLVQPADPGQVETDAASRESLDALMQRLSSDATENDFRLSLLGAQCSAVDAFPSYVKRYSIAKGSPTLTALQAALFGPVFRLHQVFQLHTVADQMQLAEGGSWGDAEAFLRRFPEEGASRSWCIQVAQREPLSADAMRRSLLWHYQTLAMRRMAAVAVAVWLYVADHSEWPERLDQLVPDYISTIPVDPFAIDGRSISYAPDARTPRLYCVGPNLTDDGGQYGIDPQCGILDPESGDVVFQLRKPPFEAQAEAQELLAPKPLSTDD